MVPTLAKERKGGAAFQFGCKRRGGPAPRRPALRKRANFILRPLRVGIYKFGFVPVVEEYSAAPLNHFQWTYLRPSVTSSQRFFRSRQVLAASFCTSYQ